MSEADNLTAKGIEAINNGDLVSALAIFEKATHLNDSLTNRSYLAFCMAKERGQLKKATAMCDEALLEESDNPVHYLNRGRIYILAGQKVEAMRLFREGLARDEKNKEIAAEIVNLGMRKPPVLPVLNRKNPLNKYLGIVLTKLGLRSDDKLR